MESWSSAQEDVAGEIARQLPEGLYAPVDLLLKICHVGRQQSVQLERIALVLGERRTFIEQRIVEKLIAEQAGFDARLPGHALPRA